MGIWSRDSRNNRRWLLQHTLSSRTRIHYPKKLLLHCRGVCPKCPKNIEQGTKKTHAWSTNCFSITLLQLPCATSLHSLPRQPREGTSASWVCSFLPLDQPRRGTSPYSRKGSKLHLGKQEHETRLQTWKDGMRRKDVGIVSDNIWRNLQHPAPGYTISGCSPCPWAPNTSDDLRPWPGCCYRAGSLLLSICLYLNWSRVSRKKKYL